MKRILFLLLPFAFMMPGLTSCGGDEPKTASERSSVSETPSHSDEVTPVIKVISKATTTDNFIVSFRVKSVSKPQVTLRWGVYKKSTSSPSYSKSSSITKTYDVVKSGKASEYYYKAEHAGFMPGDYVYFKIEARNSKSDDTATGYMIIKR
jgi:lipoprotein